MKPNFETLRLIRQITGDGVVTDDEVMTLGNYLNDSQTARRTWPGNIIFEVLKNVFEDGKLETHELKALAYILRGIELQCCGTLENSQEKAVTDPVPKDAKFEEIDFLLPMIDVEHDVAATSDIKRVSQVNLFKHECTCGDWTHKRFGFPENSPGRACRCMSLAFTDPETLKQVPRLSWNGIFFNLLDLFEECGSSFDPVPSWKLLQYEGREWLISWGDQEWANVYTQNPAKKVERYCYHMFDGRWAYAAKPIGAAAIKSYFAGDQNVGGNTTIPGF